MPPAARPRAAERRTAAVAGALAAAVLVSSPVHAPAAAPATPAPADANWRTLDPAHVLRIETTRGVLHVELRPDLAPAAVERIARLAREGVYDGLQFHRVIAGFVAQTGNPNNKDGGVSSLPDLRPEFTFRTPAASVTAVTRASDGAEGLIGALPVQTEPTRPDGAIRGWGAYCTGVMGMGRQEAVGSANSEIFFMLAPARRLDHDYTAVGRVVAGAAVLGALAVGEPPAAPDRMLRVRLLSDLPQAERPRVQVEAGPALARRIAAARAAAAGAGRQLSVCDVEIAERIVPESAP